MARRTHRKSRYGCHTCKKRHIKCDENKPVCVNCTTTGNECSFERLPLIGPASNQRVPIAVTEPSKTSESASITRNDSCSPRPFPAFDPNLNLEHLELFHQWMTQTHLTFADEDHQQEIWRVVIIREALCYPFLMHQVLAVSALHLGNTTASRSEHYYHRATQLQSAAMTGFYALQGFVDRQSCVAILIFSSLLGLHVLADRSRTESLDNNGIIDHFLHCIRLMRGVSVLVVQDWLDTIKQRPEIAPLLGPSQRPSDIPEEISHLKSLLSHPGKLGDEAVMAYTRAIDSLGWMYAGSGVPQRTYRNVRWIMAWSLHSTSQYLDLVAERRPEALIILAYYAALLHFHDSWMVGQTGPLIIKAINAHLGNYWSRWMQWPNSLVDAVEGELRYESVRQSAAAVVISAQQQR